MISTLVVVLALSAGCALAKPGGVAPVAYAAAPAAVAAYARAVPYNIPPFASAINLQSRAVAAPLLAPAAYAAAPLAAPLAAHVAAPYAAHVAAPYAAHVAAPYAAHVAAPYAAHVAAPYAAHVAAPYAAHVAAPLAAPFVAPAAYAAAPAGIAPAYSKEVYAWHDSLNLATEDGQVLRYIRHACCFQQVTQQQQQYNSHHAEELDVGIGHSVGAGHSNQCRCGTASSATLRSGTICILVYSTLYQPCTCCTSGGTCCRPLGCGRPSYLRSTCSRPRTVCTPCRSLHRRLDYHISTSRKLITKERIFRSLNRPI